MLNRLTRSSLAAAVLCTTACASSGSMKVAPDQAALAQVRKVYLGDFGSGEGSDLVKEKLRVRLLNSNRFSVVEVPDSADATLLGSAGLDKSAVNGTTEYAGSGLL